MSWILSRSNRRALPTLFKLSFAEAAAFRAEMLIWVLSTTMPLVMLPLWVAVAEEAPLHGFGEARFTAYFLATFIVRQMTAAWASWSFNYEVRSGSMSMRLLRPIHPLWTYAAENISAMPMRIVISFPVGVIALLVTEGRFAPSHWVHWACLLPALAGAWSITFLAHIAVGCLSFWTDSSIKLMDAWNAGFFVFSGYLVPVALFPPGLRELPEWLPFESQLGYPVDLLTGVLTPEAALIALGKQWAWVAVLALTCVVLWERGVRRYSAVGG